MKCGGGPGWLPCTGGPGTRCGRCAQLHWSHSGSCASGSPPIETRSEQSGLSYSIMLHIRAGKKTKENKKNPTTLLCLVKVSNKTTTVLVMQLEMLHKNKSAGRKTVCLTAEGRDLPSLPRTRWLLINMWCHWECEVPWSRHSPGRSPAWPPVCSWSLGECPVAIGRSQSGTVCSW